MKTKYAFKGRTQDGKKYIWQATHQTLATINTPCVEQITVGVKYFWSGGKV